jgi:hypothetical protein
MLKVKTLLLRGWVFLEALRDVIDELTPDDNIPALHSRAVQAGGRLKTTVSGFVHVVVMEDQAQELEAAQRLVTGYAMTPKASASLPRSACGRASGSGS